MTRPRTSLLLGLGFLMATAISAAGAPQSAGHSVGDYFPDVELPTIDGKQSLRLSSFHGQRVLLIEFASW